MNNAAHRPRTDISGIDTALNASRSSQPRVRAAFIAAGKREILRMSTQREGGNGGAIVNVVLDRRATLVRPHSF